MDEQKSAEALVREIRDLTVQSESLKRKLARARGEITILAEENRRLVDQLAEKCALIRLQQMSGMQMDHGAGTVSSVKGETP